MQNPDTETIFYRLNSEPKLPRPDGSYTAHLSCRRVVRRVEILKALNFVLRLFVWDIPSGNQIYYARVFWNTTCAQIPKCPLYLPTYCFETPPRLLNYSTPQSATQTFLVGVPSTDAHAAIFATGCVCLLCVFVLLGECGCEFECVSLIVSVYVFVCMFMVILHNISTIHHTDTDKRTHRHRDT